MCDFILRRLAGCNFKPGVFGPWLNWAAGAAAAEGSHLWSASPWGRTFPGGGPYEAYSKPKAGIVLAFGAMFGVLLRSALPLAELETKLGSVADDVERTVRFFANVGPITQFHQLIAIKSDVRPPPVWD